MTRLLLVQRILHKLTNEILELERTMSDPIIFSAGCMMAQNRALDEILEITNETAN